jgi:hypothetical protein
MTKLTDAIFAAYDHNATDTAKIARQLTERRRAVWINTLTDLARQHGCTRLAGTPKGADAKKLRDDSQRDAESISNTYNKQLRNEIERLYAANKKGNTRYYTSNLAKWQARRDTWKVYQIALNTDSSAREYARLRFYEMNANLAKRFIATGPPPVCKICIRIFAAGVVDFAYTRFQTLPAHISCPHLWKAVAPTKVSCDQLWLG